MVFPDMARINLPRTVPRVQRQVTTKVIAVSFTLDDVEFLRALAKWLGTTNRSAAVRYCIQAVRAAAAEDDSHPLRTLANRQLN